MPTPDVYAIKSPDGTVTKLEVIPAAKPSPAGSMAGWSWRTWFAKQKDALKKLVTYLSAAATIWATTVNLPPSLQEYASIIGPVLGIVVAVGTRLALDSLDYWLGNNPQ